jgi:hypothetical protein
MESTPRYIDWNRGNTGSDWGRLPCRSATISSLIVPLWDILYSVIMAGGSGVPSHGADFMECGASAE